MVGPRERDVYMNAKPCSLEHDTHGQGQLKPAVMDGAWAGPGKGSAN